MFPNPTEASMNSDHDIEVTEETSAAAEAATSTAIVVPRPNGPTRDRLAGDVGGALRLALL